MTQQSMPSDIKTMEEELVKAWTEIDDVTIAADALRVQVAELTHSLNYAAGMISGMPRYSKFHPETVVQELIDYGKKVYKEYQDA